MDGTLKLVGSEIGLSVFQFVGLLRVAEYNAHMAAQANDAMRAPHGINTLLAAFAALEALVLETAYVLQKETLYDELNEKGDRPKFRYQNLETRIYRYLTAIDRPTKINDLPPVLAEVSRLRAALTHSEPDSDRSARVGETIMDPKSLQRIAGEVRGLADWLWNGKRPKGVAEDFDKSNPLILP